MILSSLTVGQVSGIIAAAVAIVSIILPNAITAVLVGVLHNEHTAVTWSVVQRNLSASLWPSLLSTDTASGRSVSGRVRSLTTANWICYLLIAVAAITTPLGLHEAVIAGREDEAVPFSELADTSPIGVGTPTRDHYDFTRFCGSLVTESVLIDCT